MMTLKPFLLAPLACCALFACAPAPKDDAPADDAGQAATEEQATADSDAGVTDPAATPDEDLCNAADYQSLVGSNVAAVTLPAGLDHRILGPNDVATMDYRADRLNILTDENGVITEVKCG